MAEQASQRGDVANERCADGRHEDEEGRLAKIWFNEPVDNKIFMDCIIKPVLLLGFLSSLKVLRNLILHFISDLRTANLNAAGYQEQTCNRHD